MSLVATRQPVRTMAGPPPRPRRRPDATLVAVVATAISAVGVSRPSLWFDEAATISASTQRSLPELWHMLGHIDAVHGLYYLLMHGWFAIFPATEFWTRLPSCLAVGIGAAGLVVLCRQYAGRQLWVCAGVLYAVLPRVTWAGTEARPYAFAAAAAVWLTVLCVAAARRNTGPLWVGYGAAVVAVGLLNIFTVLTVAAHPVILSGRNSTARRRWACAVGVALTLLVPFVVLSQSQIRQVAWIHPLNLSTVVEVVQQQYFDNSVAFAVLAWLMLVGAEVAVRVGARPAPDPDTRRLVVLCAAWMLIPTLVTLAYSVLGRPVYYPRYLIGTAPAMAIALAVAVTTLAGSRRAVIAVVVALAVAAAPNYVVDQRDRYTKEKGWDYSAVADVIDAHAHPGDCLLIDNTTRWMPGPIRALTAARPASYAKLIDPGRGPHRQSLGRLWDGHLSVSALADQLDHCPVIWTVTNHDHTLPAHQAAVMLPPGTRFARTPDGRMLRKLGFHVVERWQFTFSQVIKAIR
ncbi:glycosyltransferase family 39 protein [[Mycobacterium] zoologicum]|nr:glycosyltransferase family 39 protein [Mycolicibacter sp. MYC101]MEB3063359.1 glycosyltransferase family 39 protein [Mycolicibacter sp. MYC101]